MINKAINILHQGDEVVHMFGMDGMFMNMWPFMGLWGLIVIFLTIWTYQDAIRVGENALFWSIVVFFTMGLAVIVYSIIHRPRNIINTQSDYSSNPDVSSKHNITTYCENCGSILLPEDNFCSECGTAVGI